MKTTSIYGIMAEFDTASDLVAAARKSLAEIGRAHV